MKIQLEPKIYPFLSETEKYCYFASLGKFSKMEVIQLLDENGKVVRELNSDDFTISRGIVGTETNLENKSHPISLYYKSEEPVTILCSSFEREKKREEIREQRRAEMKALKEMWKKEWEERVKAYDEAQSNQDDSQE